MIDFYHFILLLQTSTETDTAVHVGGGTALVMLISREVIKLVKGDKEIKNAFKEAMEETLIPHMDKQNEKLDDIRDGIKELILRDKVKSKATTV